MINQPISIVNSQQKCLSSTRQQTSYRISHCTIRRNSIRLRAENSKDAARKALEDAFGGKKDILADNDYGGGGGGIGGSGGGGGDGGGWDRGEPPDLGKQLAALIQNIKNAILGFVQGAGKFVVSVGLLCGVVVTILSVRPLLDFIMTVLRVVFRLERKPRLMDLALIEGHEDMGEYELAAVQKYGTIDFDLSYSTDENVKYGKSPEELQEEAREREQAREAARQEAEEEEEEED